MKTGRASSKLPINSRVSGDSECSRSAVVSIRPPIRPIKTVAPPNAISRATARTA